MALDLARIPAVAAVAMANATRCGAIPMNTIYDLDDKGVVATVRYIWKDDTVLPTTATTWTEDFS